MFNMPHVNPLGTSKPTGIGIEALKNAKSSRGNPRSVGQGEELAGKERVERGCERRRIMCGRGKWRKVESGGTERVSWQFSQTWNFCRRGLTRAPIPISCYF